MQVTQSSGSTITLGAHAGDNPVDYVPDVVGYLGMTGGRYEPFISSSTARHREVAERTHQPVDANHRRDLRKRRSSPLSTAPTTTTSTPSSLQQNTAVSHQPPSDCRSRRVTASMPVPSCVRRPQN